MSGVNALVAKAVQLDVQTFFFINKTCANPVCDVVMPLMSAIGSGQGIFVLSLLALLLAKAEKRKAALVLWAGLTVTYYLSAVLKETIGRPRPFLVLAGVNLLASTGRHSFPSTHAMQSFMAAAVASRYVGWHGLFYGFAILVGLSRVCMGVHYPSDVLAGAVIGAIIGYALVQFAKPE